MSSAYNKVTPTSFGSNTTMQPAKVPESPSLPEALTTFVQDCHNQAAARNFQKEQFTEMQLQLRQLIERANLQGKIWINNWSQQKLPIFFAGIPLELACNFPDSTKNKPKINKRALKQGHKGNQDEEDLMGSLSRKKARGERFEKELSYTPSAVNDEDFKADHNKPVRGTSQVLEKAYLRLTSAPDPSKVRPPQMLVKSYNLVFDKYKNGAPYSYVCDQFKSMRQDLRVQIVETDFTVKVYETHARIALENKDLGEFNQCQARLKDLYQNPRVMSSHESDFLSFRILYHCFMRNYDEITLIKLKLSDREKQNNLISHALEVLKAQLSGNYHKLFQLYTRAKATTRHLMDCFINNERVRALSTICHSYKILDMEYLLSEFRFAGEADCWSFITEMKLDQFIELKGENVYLNTADAKSLVLQALASKSKIDIKGQI